MAARYTAALFTNAKMYTLDGKRRIVRALAAEDGKIVAVGDESSVRRSAARGCEKYDLRGRTVVPGFIDCHTHFISMGVDSMSIDLSSTRTIEEALALVRAGARRIPEGEWVIAVNWKESGWTDGRFITGADLDSACPGHPAVAHRVCGHLSSVNRDAISLLGITHKTPDVDFTPSGAPSGILRESAVSIVRSATAPDQERMMNGLAIATKKAHSLGVTSITDNGEAQHLAIYRLAESADKLKVRVNFNTTSDTLDSRIELSVPTGIGSDLLKIGGVKAFCDGALGARTAAMSAPYSDDPRNSGAFVHEQSELEDIAYRAHVAGMQLAIHAIGDSGIGAALKSIISAVRKSPRPDHRHRIEHLELPTMGHLRTMGKSGVIASMQPNFIGEWGGTEGMYVSRLGRARASRNNPFREVLDSGVRLAFGSDCMPMGPLYGIHSAVNAPYPSQRLTVHEAISAYTHDAAFASFDEMIKGSLHEGMLADIVVLSDDPFAHPRDISSTKVVRTVVGGETVFVSR